MIKYCPSSLSALTDRSKIIGCDQIKRYHCLRNKKDELVEKCFEVSWIQKGDCAVYDTDAQTIDAWPCNINRGECPMEDYLSDDVMSYSACVPFSWVTNSSDGNPRRSSPNPVESRSVNVKLILPSIIVPLVLIIAMMIFVWFLRRRNRDTRQRKSYNADEASTEEIMLLDKEAEIREHLKRESEKLEFFVDNERFVPISESETVKNQILGLSHVVIVGKPGSGKTSLAWDMCKHFHGSSLGNKTCIIRVLKNDIPKMELGEDEKIILLLDNFLENASTEAAKEKLNALEHAYHRMFSYYELICILTMNNFDYNRTSEILPQKCAVVQMGESTVDMGKILEAHGITVNKNKQKRTLTEKQFLEMLEYVRDNKPLFREPVPIGLPLIASIASLNDKFLNEFSKFVEKPKEKICDLVWNLCHSDDSNDKNRFCTIIYAAFKGGKISHEFSNSDDIQLFNSIAALHNITNAVLETDWFLFRQKADGDWQFYHESILRMVLSEYGQKQPEFLVTNCPLHILLRYCTSKKGDMDERKLQIVIEIIDHLKILISRIQKETIDIKSHIMWKDKRFRDLFSKSENQV